MYAFTVEQDERWKSLHVFKNTVSIKKNMETEWETLRHIKVLRIPDKNISIYIHPDQTLHIVIS